MLGHSHIIRFVVSTVCSNHINLKVEKEHKCEGGPWVWTNLDKPVDTSVCEKVVHEFGTSLDALQRGNSVVVMSMTWQSKWVETSKSK